MQPIAGPRLRDCQLESVVSCIFVTCDRCSRCIHKDSSHFKIQRMIRSISIFVNTHQVTTSSLLNLAALPASLPCHLLTVSACHPAAYFALILCLIVRSRARALQLCAICQSHVRTLIDLPWRLHSLRCPCAHAFCVLMYPRCLALCGSCCAARVCLFALLYSCTFYACLTCVDCLLPAVLLCASVALALHCPAMFVSAFYTCARAFCYASLRHLFSVDFVTVTRTVPASLSPTHPVTLSPRLHSCFLLHACLY